MPLLRLCLLLLLPLLTPACEKEPLDTLDELVPATQEGANTLGCLIDGEVFYNRGGSLSTQDIVANSASIPYERVGIIGKDLTEWGNAKSVIVEVHPIEEGVSVPINSFAAYSIGSGSNNIDYTIDLNEPYAISATYLNLSQRIISGTFNFTVVDTLTQDRKVITDGRFDVRYF